MMNIFFAAICVYLAYSAVDMSFDLITHNFKIQTPKTEIVEAKKVSAEEVLQAGIALTKILEKPLKKIDKLSQIKDMKEIYKSIDFTPSKQIKPKELQLNSKKLSFIEVKKIPSTNIKMKVNLPRFEEKSKKAIIEEIDLELSYAEIPEQGKFKVKKIQIIAWSEKSIDLTKYANLEKSAVAKKDEQNKDRISTAASAPERSNLINNINSDSMNFQAKSIKVEFQEKATEVATLSKKTTDEELEFFDYDTPKKTEEVIEEKVDHIVDNEVKDMTQIVAQKKITFDPLSIQKQIVQTLNQSPTKSAKNEESLKKAIENIKKSSQKVETPKIAEAVTPNKPSKNGNEINNAFVKADESKNYACLDPKDLINNETYQTKYQLSLTGVDYSKNKFDLVRNFEIRFHDDSNESKKDFGSGSISLDFKMNTQMSVRRATFYSRGYLPTTTDLVFEAGNLKADIPAFTVEGFNRILEKHNLRGLGAHLLVELDDKTEDVEIDKDTNYESKLYLDKSMRVVSRSGYDYQYILFIGVEVGNTIVKFRTSKDKEITKLIHLTGDEVYYEPNFYAEVDNDFFALYEERLLSKCKSIMNIDAKKIEAWSYQGLFSKEALNKVKVRNMIYPLGTRKYYEMKHLSESIFIGRWGEESVVIPSEEYISHVISKFDLNSSDSKCVVQLNITKPISEISFNGQSGNENMNMQINILDKDGQFYDGFSEQSERAFLMGEEQGVISIKINYKDGSDQYLQSFCSNNTYIVEQL